MTFLKRNFPAIALLFIAPLIGEFLVGDFPVEQIYMIGAVLPMYGFGSLLIREAARQTDRGWPTMVVLAYVYGVLEEGLFDQSLYNPDFMNARLLEYGFIAPLGMGAVLTVFILNLHVIWSTCVPIGLVELLFAKRRTEPWLGKMGLGICGALYLAGGAMIGLHFLKTFNAAPFQHAITALLAAIGLAVAFLVFRPGKTPSALSGISASPWTMGAFAFGSTSIAMLLFQNGQSWHVPAAATVVTMLALDVAGLVYIFTSARRAGWTNMHRFALAAGALLTYCWSGFITLVTQHGSATILSHAGLVATFVAILIFLWWKLRTNAEDTQFAEDNRMSRRQ